MRSVLVERRVRRNEALRPLGLSPRFQRIWSRHSETLGCEAAMMSLPFRSGTDGSGIGAMEPLQHPVTGQAFFMVGVSEVGGDDPLATG